MKSFTKFGNVQVDIIWTKGKRFGFALKVLKSAYFTLKKRRPCRRIITGILKSHLLTSPPAPVLSGEDKHGPPAASSCPFECPWVCENTVTHCYTHVSGGWCRPADPLRTWRTRNSHPGASNTFNVLQLKSIPTGCSDVMCRHLPGLKTTTIFHVLQCSETQVKAE